MLIFIFKPHFVIPSSVIDTFINTRDYIFACTELFVSYLSCDDKSVVTNDCSAILMCQMDLSLKQ